MRNFEEQFICHDIERNATARAIGPLSDFKWLFLEGVHYVKKQTLRCSSCRFFLLLLNYSGMT